MWVDIRSAAVQRYREQNPPARPRPRFDETAKEQVRRLVEKASEKQQQIRGTIEDRLAALSPAQRQFLEVRQAGRQNLDWAEGMLAGRSALNEYESGRLGQEASLLGRYAASPEARQVQGMVQLGQQPRRFGTLIGPTAKWPQGEPVPAPFPQIGGMFRTPLPGMQPVAEAVGEVGGALGRRAVRAWTEPLGPLGPTLPGAERGENIGEAVGRALGEGIVPTEVWMAAMEAIPGVGLAPDLARLSRTLIRAAGEAGVDLTPAGIRGFIRSERGQAIIRTLRSERGELRFPGKVPEGEGQPMFHGTASPDDLPTVRQGSYVTPDPEIAKSYAEVDARIREAQGQPAGTPRVVEVQPEPGDLAAPPPESELAASRGAMVTTRDVPAGPPPAEPPPPPGGAGFALPPKPPGQRLAEALRAAQRLKPEQRAMLREQRAQRVAVAARALEQNPSEEGFITALGAHKGAFETPEFTALELTPDEINDMQRHLATGDWAGRAHYDRIKAYQSLNKLLAGTIPQQNEIDVLRRAFSELGGEVEKLRALGPKVADEIIGLLGVPQTFATSFDLSAPLRQGLVLGWSHPREWVQAWPAMIKAFGTEEAGARTMQAIRDNPWFVRGGLGFDEVGGHITDLSVYAEQGAREGQWASLNRSFISRTVQRIPGIRQSERAFATFLNKLRMDVYASTAQRMWDSGVRDPVQFKALASTINHATGWGDWKVGQVVQGVNAFFSPRNLTARFQVVLDPFTKPGSLLKPSARQEAARNLVGFVGTTTAMLALVDAVGLAPVELNPWSTDWGKIRLGNTRIDVWGGYSPMARLVAQMASGERRQINPITGKAEMVKVSRPDLVKTFLRNKMGLVPSVVLDVFAGQNPIGEPTKVRSGTWWRNRAYEMMVPFFAQDVNDAVREHGWPGLAIAPAAATGVGTLTYSTMSDKQRALIDAQRPKLQEQADAGDEAAKDALTALDQGVVPNAIRELPEWQALQTEKQQQPGDYATVQATRGAAQQAAAADFERTRDGKTFREQISDANNEARIAMQGMDFPDKDGTLDRYFAATYERASDPTTHRLDQDALDQYIAEWTAQATPEERTAVREWEVASDNPTVRQYKQDRQRIEDFGYWSVEDNLWAKGGGISASARQQYRTFRDYKAAIRQKILDNASKHVDPDTAATIADTTVDGLPQIKRFEGYVAQIQEGMRRNPKLLQLLKRWGYKTSAKKDIVPVRTAAMRAAG